MLTLSLALLAASTPALDAYVCLGSTARSITETRAAGREPEARLLAAQTFWLEQVRPTVPNTADASLIEDARVSRLDQPRRAYRRDLRRCLSQMPKAGN